MAIETYDFQFSRYEIWPRLMQLFKVSFLTTLDIYKAYLRAVIHRYRDQETYFLYVKLLCLYAIRLCN